jgi:hypothetical protein
MRWGVLLSIPGDPPNTGNAVPRRPWRGWAEDNRGAAKLFECREGAEQEAIAIAGSCFADRYDAIRVREHGARSTGERIACTAYRTKRCTHQRGPR